MKVEVLYRSHRYEEFDTSLTCPEPHRKEGVSILTDWNLYLGDLKGQGVILVQHWYRRHPAPAGREPGQLPVRRRDHGDRRRPPPRQRHAPRRPGRAGRHRVAQEGRGEDTVA